MKTTKKITFFAFAIATLFIFAQCTAGSCNNDAAGTNASVSAEPATKIVYVDLDSLMSNYNLAKDINKAMMRKEEDFKMKLNDKYKALQADQADFERKYKNNIYATPERAQEEYNRIVKKEQEIIQLEQQLTAEFEKEGLEKNQILRDSISQFIKEYNEQKGYDYILTKLGENILYANETLNITKEIVDGLNSRYAASQK